MTREPICSKCALYRSCPYPAIFETPPPETHSIQAFSQVPGPYVIEPPEWGARIYEHGELLSFQMVLAGRGLDHLALITHALRKAFEFEVGHGNADLVSVEIETPNGYIDVYQDGVLIPHESWLLMPEFLGDATVNLLIETPIRLQENGKPMGPDRIGEYQLITTLTKRHLLLSELHFQQSLDIDFEAIKEQSRQVIGKKNLTWLDWTRYSSRQRQKMQLGGCVGSWQLENVSCELQQLLWLGQWLHVGKNCSFGLGKYFIE